MIRGCVILVFAMLSVAGMAAEFRHVGDFLLSSHFKITGDKVTPVPMKPMAFRVFTDGIQIRITTADDNEASSSFDIYRSDGIGRLRKDGGALEVIPGVQAMSKHDGTIRHLRLSRESLTITTFPGVSDQTIVSHAIAAEPIPEVKSSPEARPTSNP
jgi:hypothetical protein